MSSARKGGGASLHDENVVVIGGSTGIGLATARMAHALGARVTIAGRSQEKLDHATHTLPGVRGVRADATLENEVRALFAAMDNVDHLFISAGSLVLGKGHEADDAAVKKTIDERIWTNVLAVRHAAPRMKRGSVTLVSGIRADRPKVGSALTSAGVAFAEGFARSLALELAPVRVNAIAPGWIDTPLVASVLGAKKHEVLAAEAAALPAGIIGSADQAAAAVIFLMTNAFMTGEVLHIDGGGRLV